MYVAIVEFGKFRQAQVLCHFDKFLQPENYRHLYSNVDNILFALSTPTLEDAVYPHLKQQYDDEKKMFFNSNEPGHLKEEFHFLQDEEWKFVTPMTHNYAIITKKLNTAVHKNSAINNLSSHESFETCLKLLKNQTVSVQQKRRVNKLINTEMQEQTFVFNKN